MMKSLKRSSFVLLFLLPLVTIAQEVMTPMDVAKLRTITSFEVSPDSKYVVYTLSTPADPLKENKPSHNQMYLLDLVAGQSRPFITQGSPRGLTFRPEHGTLTFLDRRDGDKTTSLYEISLGGGEAMNIFSTSTSLTSFSWSADGKQLAYLANEQNVVEDSAPKLPYEPEIYEENLPFRKGYVQNMDGGSTRQITVDGHLSRLSFSPDGRKLCLVTAPTPLVDDSYMQQTIMTLDASTFKVLGIVEHSAKLGEIAWSPDSKNLAFIAGEDVHDPTAGRLLVVPVTGGKPQNIKPDYPGMFEDIDWKDNQTIQFVASQGTMSALGTVRSNGSGLKHQLKPADINLSSFRPLSDGGFVFDAESPTHPFEIFLMKKGEKIPNRMTDSNPWLKERRFAKQEVITYKARDGREIEGILIHPLDEKPGVKYPMITVVHGGPESHYNNGWLTGYSNAGQVGAARGFAVFYPNYRGSTGRGVEFTKSSQGDLAGSEFDDIVDGVDYLVESGLIEKGKVGVTGGSYGGYATGWLSTYYSDRFAAGVMFVGISNNLSKWGTSDIPEELYLVHARKRVWDDYEWWLKRSPVYHVDKAKTPLLIMHGKNDTRVYPGQSMELYRHIKTRTDTPVRLVFYPGEGHGNRNSTARLDYNLRSMRWFEKYLKNEKVNLEAKVDPEVK